MYRYFITYRKGGTERGFWHRTQAAASRALHTRLNFVERTKAGQRNVRTYGVSCT